MNLTSDQLIFWQHGFFKLNQTIVTTWAMMLLMAFGAMLITRRLRTEGQISRWQGALEIIVTTLETQIKEVGLAAPRKYLAFLGTLFVFVATCAVCIIIPGYKPPTESLSTTAALALCVFLAVPLYGIREQGLGGYRSIENFEIRASGLSVGVNPLGGAGVHYWEPIAKRYGLNLKVVNETVDPTFRFMTLDWDGKIRMDPSSEYAVRPLIALKDKFDLAIACDTDHDRHGIVTRSVGLLPPNHYLAVCVDYLFQHRPHWSKDMAVGKTVVSSSMIDRVAARLGRKLYEVPVGFKYFVDGLLNGTLGFAGEESAGSSFARIDGSVWTTDKDGIIAALLAAEITAVCKKDPGELYTELAAELGDSHYRQSEAPATNEQKAALEHITANDIQTADLAGEKPITITTKAAGDGNSIGGIKVFAASGWFAARPSGTEAIYKIYAESFSGEEHLALIEAEAQTVANEAFASAAPATMNRELQETK